MASVIRMRRDLACGPDQGEGLRQVSAPVEDHPSRGPPGFEIAPHGE